MEVMSFGETFIRGVKAVYTEQSANVIINGILTDTCKITKGTRQGCPLSPLLFILVLEVLARKIREDKDIQGIQLGQQTQGFCR